MCACQGRGFIDPVMTVIDCVAGSVCFSYFTCSATCATTMKCPTNSAETVRRSSKASSKSGGEKPHAMITLSESLANPYPPCATCGAVFGETHHPALTDQLAMWGDYHWATEADTWRALFLKAREKLVARIRRAGRSELPSPCKSSRKHRSSRPASPEA